MTLMRRQPRVSRLIVCAKTPSWAVAIRREALPDGWRVYETRSLKLCREEVSEHPASLLAVELTRDNLESLAAWLSSLTKNFRLARVIVLGSRGLEPCEWVLREAGAVHAIFSIRELGPVVRLAARHLKREPRSGPAFNDAELRSAAWDRLPWSFQA